MAPKRKQQHTRSNPNPSTHAVVDNPNLILRKFKDKEQNEEFSISEPSAEAIQHTHISIPASVPLHPHAVTCTSSPSIIQTTVYTPSVTQATTITSIITSIPTVITSTNTASVSTASTVI